MNKRIRRKAYELYKLDWMSSNGKTLTEMIEKLEEYQISLNSKDINLQELFKIWEEKIGFGGGCINDTLIHLATSEMPFGGFGESGMGSYHGKTGFDTFTHYKSIVDKKTWIDLTIRYRPYHNWKRKLLCLFLK